MNDTRTRLLDAAERLFAEKGLHATPTREIVAAAGQRNESAIQYHFGGRGGLLDAIHARRLREVEQARAERLDALLAREAEPQVRAVLDCVVAPVVRQCGVDPGFRGYLAAFGELALSAGVSIGNNPHELASLARVRMVLKPRLKIEDEVLRERTEALTRFILMILSQWARSDRSFEGAEFDLFLANFVDMAAALLIADVSKETRAALERCRLG